MYVVVAETTGGESAGRGDTVGDGRHLDGNSTDSGCGGGSAAAGGGRECGVGGGGVSVGGVATVGVGGEGGEGGRADAAAARGRRGCGEGCGHTFGRRGGIPGDESVSSGEEGGIRGSEIVFYDKLNVNSFRKDCFI